jgi:acetylornithine deacetylase/succinyl-diaminopimelate desuccinylase-like protein
MTIHPAMSNPFATAIQPKRLLDMAMRLINVPSPTRSAAAAADCLEDILSSEGFDVSRPVAGWPESPAVVTTFDSGKDGRKLQFNGHLDTVHLPFVPARVENGKLYGSGASDMKGGLAAAIEAVMMLRDTDLLPGGSILLTAHDLHESPWGDGSQVRGLIEEGWSGDGVLLPEYLAAPLPVAGRGQSIIDLTISREGEPVHEVLGGIDQPQVIAAGAELVCQFRELDQQLSKHTHPLAGRESCFIGEIHAGEIYNQAPTTCRLAGTRRWIPGTDVNDVQKQYEEILSKIEQSFGVQIKGDFRASGHAYEIDISNPLVTAVQAASRVVSGSELPIGAKPFADDGNKFVNLAGIPAITHGPAALGAHTTSEEVPLAELERVAMVYAATAIEFCGKRRS